MMRYKHLMICYLLQILPSDEVDLLLHPAHADPRVLLERELDERHSLAAGGAVHYQPQLHVAG